MGRTYLQPLATYRAGGFSMHIPYEWRDKLRDALRLTASLETANPTKEWFIRQVLSRLGLQTPQAVAKAGLPDAVGLLKAIELYYDTKLVSANVEDKPEVSTLITEAVTAEEDYNVEKAFAQKVISGQASLEQFPYFDDYRTTMATEHQKSGGGPVLFIGGGPVPISAILLATDHHMSTTVMELMPEAVQLSNALIKKLGISGIRVLQGDGRVFSGYGQYKTIYVALEAGPTRETKEAIFTQIAKQVTPNTTLLVRGSANDDFLRVDDFVGTHFSVVDKVSVFSGYSTTFVLKPKPSPEHSQPRLRVRGTKTPPEGVPETSPLLTEREDLAKADAVRSVVDGYPDFLASKARALVEKYSDPSVAGRRGAALTLRQELHGLTHFQGKKIKVLAPPDPGDEGQYEVHNRTVTVFDEHVAGVLTAFQRLLLSLASSHRTPAQVGEAKQAALLACDELVAADWSRLRNTFYHEITHQQDDERGQMKPSFKNLRKQIDDNPKLGSRMNRYYYNSAHETNARFVARVAEMSGKYEGQELPEAATFIQEFVADDQLYYEHLTGENKKATLKRIYDLYQQLKTGAVLKESLLLERNDASRITAMRQIADGYFDHFKRGLQAFYDKYIGAAYDPEEAPYLSTVRSVYWDELFRYQGLSFHIESSSATGLYARYRPAFLSRGRKLPGVVILYDTRVAAYLKELEDSTIDYQSSYTKPQARAAARRQAVAAYRALMEFDYTRFRHDLYHELTHHQDDEQGWLMTSAENMAGQRAGTVGLKSGRIYLNSPHEMNAHFLAVAGEITSDLEKGVYKLPASYEAFQQYFTARPELQYAHMSAENRRRVLTRAYAFYQTLQGEAEGKTPLTEGAESTTPLTPDAPMYRFCADEEIELVVNGGRAGGFWLDRPYYGQDDHVYLKTTFGTLRTQDQARYQNGSTMTASGQLGGQDPYEVVAMRGGQEIVLPKDPYRWNIPPAELSETLSYRDDDSPLEYEAEADPNITVRRYKHNSVMPFVVSKRNVDKQVPFMDLESAARFVTKLLQGFDTTLLHENHGHYGPGEETPEPLEEASSVGAYYRRLSERVQARHTGKPEPPKLARPRGEQTLPNGEPRYTQTIIGVLDRLPLYKPLVSVTDKDSLLREVYDDFVRKDKVEWSRGRTAYEAERDPQLLAHALMADNSVYNDGGLSPETEAGKQRTNWEVLCFSLRRALEGSLPLLKQAQRHEQLDTHTSPVYRLRYTLDWQTAPKQTSATTGGVEDNLAKVLRKEPVAGPTHQPNRGELVPQLQLAVVAHPDARTFLVTLSVPPAVAEAYPELAEHCTQRETTPIAFGNLREVLPHLLLALDYFEQFCQRRFGPRLSQDRKPGDVLLQEGRDRGEKLSVTISNLDPHDKQALVAMFTAMNWAASAGAHRGFSVSMDGDGSFRAQIEMEESVTDEEEQELIQAMEDEKLHIGLGG